MKYIIITPTYNDGNCIERTIQSVIKQSIQPAEWVIVNDNSTDNTIEIVTKYLKKYTWMKLFSIKRKPRTFGSHVSILVNYGLTKITYLDYQFIVKLDSDLEIDSPLYFEKQLNEFSLNPSLGITSGITYSYINNIKVLTKGRPEWHTGGAMKMYRRDCFNEIEGIAPIMGWDGLDEYKAMYRGWVTRTYFDLHVHHLGKKRALNRAKQPWLAELAGNSFYLRGYPRLFIALKGLTYIKYGVRSCCSFYFGFFKGVFNRQERYVNVDEIKFIKKIFYRSAKNFIINIIKQ